MDNRLPPKYQGIGGVGKVALEKHRDRVRIEGAQLVSQRTSLLRDLLRDQGLAELAACIDDMGFYSDSWIRLCPTNELDAIIVYYLCDLCHEWGWLCRIEHGDWTRFLDVLGSWLTTYDPRGGAFGKHICGVRRGDDYADQLSSRCSLG